MSSLATPTHKRRVCCRYRRRDGEMCTGEALEPDGEIILCGKHTARAIIMAKRRAAAARAVGAPVALGAVIPETLASIPADPQ